MIEKGIEIGLEQADGTRRHFPRVVLRRASPDEEKTLRFVRDEEGE